jgi:hypothetical protein
MTALDDLRILGPSINDVDLLTIAAVTTDGQYPDLPNIHEVSILIPPTELMMCYFDTVNENPAAEAIFKSEYAKYLDTKDPDDMIVSLLAALTVRNVVIYIPHDEFRLFGDVLLNHIYYRYGIICNFRNTVFNFDVTKVPFIMSKFYMIGVMEAQVYLKSYPINVQMPPFVIDALYDEVRPNNVPVSFMEKVAYIDNLRRNMMPKPENLKPMVSVVSRGDKS